MNDGQSARTQLVERIKSSNNILVTLSKSPSVDELSSALGLTIMLNGMNKHATAVVSGDIPPAITFLEPNKTFENTVDSLRDFIIALDKEKADHLRYKVDGDVVKIFITPYRTTLSEDDLDFSQGDYNVELVLALGVKDKDDLDGALASHGRILHDATVATLSCGDSPSNLGSIDWFDANASSLAEMLVSLSESLKGDQTVLDEQSATALLTGIVAATDRFSNNRTSSKVMTMAAQLMAAGANQQLIAAKLEEAHEIGSSKKDSSNNDSHGSNNDGTTDLTEGESSKVSKETKKAEAKKEESGADGSLAISHEKEGNLDEVAQQTAKDDQAEAAKTAEDELTEQLTSVAPAAAAKPSVSDLQKDLASANNDVTSAAQSAGADEAVLPPVVTPAQDGQPSMGGTLNATTEQARADSEAEQHKQQNKKILSHNTGSYVGDEQPTYAAPFNATNASQEEPRSVDIFDGAKPAVNSDHGQEAPKPRAETLADLDKQNRSDDHSQAQAAVAAAFDSAAFEPANQPTASVGAQPLGDVLQYEETALPTPPAPQTPVSEFVAESQSTQPQQAAQAPVAPPETVMPPLPPVMPPVAAPAPVDFSVLPPPPPVPGAEPTQPSGPLPPEQLGQIFQSPPQEQQQAQQPTSNDPGQFKIPGQ